MNESGKNSASILFGGKFLFFDWNLTSILAMSPPPGFNLTNFNCPLCGAALFSQSGHQLDSQEGVTVWCGNPDCPAQEVFGYGRNEKEAFAIIQDRYKKDA